MIKIDKRPLLISILGYFLIIGGALFILKIALLGSFTVERNIVNIILKSFAIVCGIGYLKMKKWAFYLWIIGFVVGSTLIFVWSPSEEVLNSYSSFMGLISLLIVPIVITAITVKYWEKLK